MDQNQTREAEIQEIDLHGRTAYERGDYGEAACALEKLREKGVWSEGHASLLAHCLHIVGRPGEALVALSRYKDSLDPSMRLLASVCLSELGLFDEARAVLATTPDDLPALFSQHARLLIREGSFLEGFRVMAKEEQQGFIERRFPVLAGMTPLVPGESLSGKRLLVVEQGGFGDAILSMRFLERYAQLGAEIWTMPSKAIEPLYRSLPNVPLAVTSADARGLVFDRYTTDSAARAVVNFGITDPGAGFTFPYIFADSKKAEAWRPEIESFSAGRPKIGIHFQGKRYFPLVPTLRDIPFSFFERFSDLGALFSFQRDEAVSCIAGREDIKNLGQRFLDAGETAAALAHMDFVVTNCCFLAHLAGAMGKRTALLVYTDPYFPWVVPGVRTDWYPSVRVFRQEKFGEWELPVSQAYDAIRHDIEHGLKIS